MASRIEIDGRTQTHEARTRSGEALSIRVRNDDVRSVFRVRSARSDTRELARATVDHGASATLEVATDAIDWRIGAATLLVERASGDPYRDQTASDAVWTRVATIHCSTRARRVVQRALAAAALAPVGWSIVAIVASRGAMSTGVLAAHVACALLAAAAAVFTIRVRTERGASLAAVFALAALALVAFERRASVRIDNQTGRAIRLGPSLLPTGSSRALAIELRVFRAAIAAQRVEQRESDPCTSGRSRPRWIERSLPRHTLRPIDRPMLVDREVEQWLFARDRPRALCNRGGCCVDVSSLTAVRGRDGAELFEFVHRRDPREGPSRVVIRASRAQIESAQRISNVSTASLEVHPWQAIDVRSATVRFDGWELEQTRGSEGEIVFDRYPQPSTTPFSVEFELEIAAERRPLVVRCDAGETLIELFREAPRFVATRPLGAYFVRCGRSLARIEADASAFEALASASAPTLSIPAPSRSLAFVSDDVGRNVVSDAQRRAADPNSADESEQAIRCPQGEPTFSSSATLECFNATGRAYSVRPPSRAWEIQSAYVLAPSDPSHASPSSWYSHYCATLDEECDARVVAWPTAMVCFDPQRPPLVRVTMALRGEYFLPQPSTREPVGARELFARPRMRDGRWTFVPTSFDRARDAVCCQSRAGRWSACSARYYEDPVFAATEYLDPIALVDASARDPDRPASTRGCVLFAQRRYQASGDFAEGRYDSTRLWLHEAAATE
ncbi:MAG: hypothetical protein JNK05_10380 [Myxococcales bacterium]|nr:hypothetical protein [Myxococcales bacterium]